MYKITIIILLQLGHERFDVIVFYDRTLNNGIIVYRMFIVVFVGCQQYVNVGFVVHPQLFFDAYHSFVMINVKYSVCNLQFDGRHVSFHSVHDKRRV
uniref:11.4 kDa protein n=1 Tax=Autographa californica nuclear polyhedrosis virus TaxID=46015 RepID=Q64805_NPVAC|nr:11.4 kDa protein [Autographa californica nucleopolyhedrovirus]